MRNQLSKDLSIITSLIVQMNGISLNCHLFWGHLESYNQKWAKVVEDFKENYLFISVKLPTASAHHHDCSWLRDRGWSDTEDDGAVSIGHVNNN